MSNILSETFRAQSNTAWTLLWENITGARLNLSTCSAQFRETCEASTIMPRRFISITVAQPSFDKPPWTGPTFEVDESANALLQT